MSERIPLLLNPQAGSLFKSGLHGWLEEHGEAFRIIPTESATQLTQTAAELAAKGEAVVAAAGGDGTLMCAAQGLVGSPSALGILPSGTMNVFSREMGIGSRRFDVALQAMRSGLFSKVDIFCVNDKPFLQMAGFGADARIIQLISPKLKRRFGAAAHILTAIQVAKEHQPNITLRLPNGKEYYGSQLIFGNGKRYAGETHLFADASYNDGLLDAAIVQQDGLGILLELSGYMAHQGATEHNTSEITRLIRCKDCEIEADGRLPYELDGDFVGCIEAGETAKIRLLPDKLKVCALAEPIPYRPMERFLNRYPLLDKFLTRLRNDSQY